MIIAIVGSRKFKALDKVEDIMYEYASRENTFISGGASGVDTVVREYCNVHKFSFKEYKPDFSKGYDVKQYFVRNDAMIEAADKVIVFWDGKSKGAGYMINQAIYKKKDLEVYFEVTNKDSERPSQEST